MISQVRNKRLRINRSIIQILHFVHIVVKKLGSSLTLSIMLFLEQPLVSITDFSILNICQINWGKWKNI